MAFNNVILDFMVKYNNRRYTMRKKGLIIYMLFGLMLAMSGCGKASDTGTESTQASTASDAVPEDVTTKDSSPDMDGAGYYIADDTVRVTAEIANVYVSADTGASIFRIAEQDTQLYRTGYNDTWSRVRIQNTDFYVLSSEVEVVETTEEPLPAEADTATGEDASRAKKIVIDAGNQAESSNSVEAVGPGSGDTKTCATAGITGTTFGTSESLLNLTYAKLLKTELENRGYEVVLTRDTDDVDISNKSRADIANSSGASAYIRIEMNESSNSELSGVMAVCMTADSPYNSELYNDSRELATRLLQGITETMDINNCGIYETDAMTAVNWSEIPVAELHLGFLTNATDEANLTSEEYQSQLVTGIADGIDYFIN